MLLHDLLAVANLFVSGCFWDMEDTSNFWEVTGSYPGPAFYDTILAVALPLAEVCPLMSAILIIIISTAVRN